MKLRSLVLCLFIASVIAVAGCKTSDGGSADSANPAASGEAEASEQPAASQENSDHDGEPAATASTDKANAEADVDVAETDPVELAITGQARPFEGIITAAQPTEEQFDQLADAGVTHVINLRTEQEAVPFDEQASAENMGLMYTQIPIGGPDDLTRENVEAFDAALAKSDGDTLVHCGSSNRVGAMFALRAFWLQGKGVNQAIEIGEKAGMENLESAVREKIE